MDADLEARQERIDREYREESLRVVKAGGVFSNRLSKLLDEQDAVLSEQFRRDDSNFGFVILFVVILVLVAFVFAAARHS